VSKPTRTGPPGPGDRVAGAAARARAVATRADQPSRFDGAGADVVHRVENFVPHVPRYLALNHASKAGTDQGVR
jgi:hypothetical protein